MRTLTRVAASCAAAALSAALLGTPWAAWAAPAQAGFDLTVGDVKFILQQIQIADAHRTRESPNCTVALGLTVTNCAVPGTNVVVPGSASPTDLSDPRLMLGLRQVDGRNNNLVSGWSRWNGVTYTSTGGNSAWGSADQPFPRITPERWRPSDVSKPEYGPVATGYNPALRPSNVVDGQPRLVSNLVADQSAANPAAVSASGADVTGLTDAQKAALQLPILNTAANVGVGPPASGMFSLFGQFFDHGLDLVGKTGSEVVFIPLAPDDPLYVPGARTNFMVLNRTVLDANNAGTNTTTPWIDQNQTYTSHPSHQVFLRAYGCGTTTNTAPATQCSSASRPVATGALLDGQAAKSLATWDDVKSQARTKLGIALSDYDVTNVPLLATDEYGRFLRGPNGFPLLVLTNGALIEGNPAAPVPTVDMATITGPVDLVRRTGHAFLDDIAHGASPAWAWDGTRWAAKHNSASLGKHYVTGDGRGNENIGLTAIHSVFHSEHNRLLDQLKAIITANESSASSATRFAYGDWRATNAVGADWNGERLMQAARLVNEMEYQHLVFGEFIRRVQPLVRAFAAYDPTQNPNITAEFANATYRYGHSQLDEDIERIAADGSDNSLPLFDAFLSPAKFTLAKDGSQLTTDQAIGQIARGMSNQRASEIDEFVTGALRNQLLGMPLDLGSLNIARGRDTGMPGLNGVRRVLYSQSGDMSLQPYASWIDFGLSLRHQATLVNLVAAYGTHPSISTASTIAGKRAAAALLVNGGPGAPSDRSAFLSSTGAWASDPVTRVTTTGVDDVDFWIGGLAERRPDFGGLLGSTFDRIFTTQMQNLQETDRFYYLGRLAGLNLAAQLETNNLSEIIMRNSDAQGLPALIFDYPTLRFTQTNPASAYPEIQVLPDGTWRYGGGEHVVFDGGPATSRQWSGSGSDTLRGNDGNDDMEGDLGDDTLIGGAGDDTITDTSGVDVLTGGPGNDFIASGGSGLDTFNGGSGADVMVAGGFGGTGLGGPGNDSFEGGTGADLASGDGGDDWLEGGPGADSLTGDAIAPFGLDVDTPGNDVMLGNAGNDLDDGAGGMDISVGGEISTDAVTGSLGFDWRTYYNPAAMNPVWADLANLVPAPGNVQAGLGDTFVDVEGLSGGDLPDTLLGTSRTTLAVAGTPNGDILTSADLPVINGLSALLGVTAANAPVTSWSSGDILLGGGSSDSFTPLAGDDLVDGDAYLRAQLSVPSTPGVIGPTTPDPARAGRVLIDSLEQARGALERREFNPSQVIIVRTIGWAPHDAETDTVVYAGPISSYSIAAGPGGLVRVTDNRKVAAPEGTDTLRGIERLQFSDGTVNVAVPNPPRSVTVTGSTTSAAVTWLAANAQTSPKFSISGYVARAWSAPTGGTVLASCTTGGGGRNCTISGLTPGRSYYVDVVTTNSAGSSAAAPLTRTSLFVPGIPIAPSAVTTTPSHQSAGIGWTSLAGPGAGVTYTARAWSAATGGTQVSSCSGTDITTCSIGGLTNGTTYYVDVSASNGSGTSTSASRATVVPTLVVPGAPTVTSVVASSGQLQARWSAPVSDGGSPITSSTARAWSTATGGSVVSTCTVTSGLSCDLTGLSNGTTYYVDVTATNGVGNGPASARRSGSPAGVPSAPGSPAATVAVDRTTALGWSASRANGALVTAYTATAWSASSGGTALTSCSTSGALSCTLPPLPAGTRFWVDVTATNTIGTGPASPRLAVLVPGPPSAPAAPTATYPASGRAQVSWTAPATNGAPITGYTATAWSASTGGTSLATCTTVGTLSCTLTGLTPGGSAWIGVTATNTVGTGTESPRLAASLPSAPPAPSTPTATYPAAGQAVVSWAAPGADGGSPLTGYTATAWSASTGGSQLAQCSTDGALTCTLTGLTPGGSAWISVAATNLMGTGAESARLAATLPNAPAGTVSVVMSYPSSGTAKATWGAPDDGGSPITGYTAIAWSASTGGTQLAQCVTSEALTCTVSGLTPGATVWVAVTATNSMGASVVSPRVSASLPTAPASPAEPTATYPSTGRASVEWSEPADGGSTITGYTVTAWSASSGGTSLATCSTGGSLTCDLTGLTPGTTAWISVTATNAIGTSAPSPRLSAALPAPPATPGTPSATYPVPGTASVTWAAPDDGGSAITGYAVTAWSASAGGSQLASCTTEGALACTLTGLTPGATVWISVTATNAMGTSAASPRLSAALPSAPAAPGMPSATYPVSGAASVAWTAPANGGSPITGYAVTAWSASVGGSQLASCTTDGALTCTLTGLTPGATVWIWVTATNAMGTSAASPRLSAPLPAAPAGSVAPAVSFPALGEATVTWTAPAERGSPITGYTATAWSASSGGTLLGQCSTVSALTCTITALTPGSTAWLTVHASSEFGDGPDSPRTEAALPAPPTAPNELRVTPALVDTAQAVWAPPTSDGGSPVTSYRVRVYGSQVGGTALAECDAVTPGCTLTGLRRGGSYWVSVDAASLMGRSPETARVRVVLPSLPGRPARTAAAPGTAVGTVRITWTPPLTTGGAPVLRYRASLYSTSTGTVVAARCSTARQVCVVSGLKSGRRYYVAVRAENVAGPSPATTRVAVVAR